jgi:hypothetical protein
MAANIFGQRFLGVREPAWHQIGTVLPEPTTAVEGLKLVDGDFQIVKAPTFIEVQTLFGTQRLTDDGRYAIVREPTDDSMEYAVLGHCGEQYEIIQRADFAQALDKLTSRWPVETIGLLGKGETVFFTLDAGMIDVGGEEVHQYFLVFDRVDGKTSAKIAFTPVRVVCQNTLTVGLREATISAALDHRRNINRDFQFRIDLMDKMADAQRLTINTFELMAKSSITPEVADQIFAAAYPYPTRPAKMDLATAIEEDDELLSPLRLQGVRASDVFAYYCGRADTLRAGARELFGKFNDEQPQLGNTVWAAYNAVTELADWREGEETVPVSALFGARATEKRRAFNAAAAVIR